MQLENGKAVKFRNVIDVARWRLCVGCGACESVCPEQRIELVDVEDEGIINKIEIGTGKLDSKGLGSDPMSLT